MAETMTMPVPLPPSSKQAPVSSSVWDWTKRRKWADLLVNELAGTIILVLSPTAEVLYCGAAAVELLGWKEEDVVDTSLISWIHEGDQSGFKTHFKNCVESQSELSTFARFSGNTNDGQWHLFEIRGHPYYDHSSPDECKCFFAMARPYPSRNTAMLDSFLELKIENMRLRQRLMELRPSNYPPPPYLSAPAISNVRGGDESGPMYQASAPYFPAAGGRSTFGVEEYAYERDRLRERDRERERERELQREREREREIREREREHDPGYSQSLSQTRVRPREEDGEEKEEPTKKKKIRRTPAGTQQYVCVTCGRTDSPEWRKGPLGAKTLCNACGLRWAKRNQKRKNDGSSTANAVQDGPANPGNGGGAASAGDRHGSPVPSVEGDAANPASAQP